MRITITPDKERVMAICATTSAYAGASASGQGGEAPQSAYRKVAIDKYDRGFMDEAWRLALGDVATELHGTHLEGEELNVTISDYAPEGLGEAISGCIEGAIAHRILGMWYEQSAPPRAEREAQLYAVAIATANKLVLTKEAPQRIDNNENMI